MKTFIKKIAVYLLTFLIFAFCADIFLFASKKISDNKKNIVMNRIGQQFQNQEVFSEKIEVDKKEYYRNFGKENFPDAINYYPSDKINFTEITLTENDIQKIIYPVKNNSSGVRGFIIFEYRNNNFKKMIFTVNVFFVLAFFFILVFALYVLLNILKPFTQLIEYPERLSRGQITEKLPETKNRYFGKYIWAMNMLQDVLENERRKVSKLIKDKQTLTGTFAHGIKTPVSNIKLYADAIQTGLYSETVSEKDAEIAGKIAKNADDIQNLVSEILNSSTKSLFEYEPQITTFYMSELNKYICTEYENKMKIKKISFSIEMPENPLIESDRNGLCRILFQLIDNAIKYGDGVFIKIKMERQDKNYYFSVVNSGSKLLENEIPYMFNSYWRGSNADGIEGQGIGLYEARQIARKLGGDIFVDFMENQLEVLLMI